ncbi:MAG: diacylglycerol kinase (ATP) [Myxococcota bacterium]
MARLAVITNPRARRNRRHLGRRQELEGVVAGVGEVWAPDGFDELAEVLTDLHARAVPLLVVDGGDGTLHRVLSTASSVWGDDPLPRVAILRGGTMNIVADSIGSRGASTDVLARIVAHVRAGEPLRRTVRWALGVEGRLGFLFGNGIVARYLEVHYEGGGSVWNAARLLGAGALSAMVGGPLAQRLSRPWTGEVVLDGASHGRRDWTAVAIGTVEQIGLQFTPFPDVASSPGQLQLVEVGGGIGSLARDLPNIYLGRHLKRPGNATRLGRRVILRGDSEMAYMLDGEFYRGGAELVVEPQRPVEFVLPAP